MFVLLHKSRCRTFEWKFRLSGEKVRKNKSHHKSNRCDIPWRRFLLAFDESLAKSLICMTSSGDNFVIKARCRRLKTIQLWFINKHKRNVACRLCIFELESWDRNLMAWLSRDQIDGRAPQRRRTFSGMQCWVKRKSFVSSFCHTLLLYSFAGLIFGQQFSHFTYRLIALLIAFNVDDCQRNSRG